jgi:hypothetical protein
VSALVLSATVHDGAVVVFIMMLVAVLVVASIAWRVSRSRSILHEWAADHGFQADLLRIPLVRARTFLLDDEQVPDGLRVTIEDGRGSIRKGWVRCGTWLAGLWSRQVDVRWDDVPHQPGLRLSCRTTGRHNAWTSASGVSTSLWV